MKNCDTWQQSMGGWWNYFRLAEDRTAIFRLGGMDSTAHPELFMATLARRQGRENALRRLGIVGRRLKAALTGRGAWQMS